MKWWWLFGVALVAVVVVMLSFFSIITSASSCFLFSFAFLLLKPLFCHAFLFTKFPL